MSVAVAEAPAPIGHNLPPNLQTFEAHRVNIESIYEECGHWLDGTPIENQAQMDEVTRLLDMVVEADDAAEASRKEEKAPWDEKVKEVQDRYNPLIGAKTKAGVGKTTRAKEALQAARSVWLRKLGDERLAEAARLRKEAEAKAAAAAEAVRAAQAGSSLQEREEAEALVTAATQASVAANRVEKAPTGLRRSWVATMVDPGAALRHYAAIRRAEVLAFLQGLADADVRGPIRTIPGFTVTPDRKAR